MTRVCIPGSRTGRVLIPSSKSAAHRLLICAALSEHPVTLDVDGLSRDILATAECLRALGAQIEIRHEKLFVQPIRSRVQSATLDVGESGSTLRFLLPLVGALGVNAVFRMHGRLPERPLFPLDRELAAHGMTLCREDDALFVSGQLEPGLYTLPGDVSSQYVSGLLFALPLLHAESTLRLESELQSAPYVDMTLDALSRAQLCVQRSERCYRIPGVQRYRFGQSCTVEGDWSNAAFFLCMGALSPSGVRVAGLNSASSQGDRACIQLLRQFGAHVSFSQGEYFVQKNALHACHIDAGEIPDLVPVLSVVAALSEGETHITNAARLRLKESDRLKTTAAMLQGLGADVRELPDGLVIRGRPQLSGGTVDSYNDHRIAMAAAVAACSCTAPVTVLQAQCVEKSYPRFWDDYEALEVLP